MKYSILTTVAAVMIAAAGPSSFAAGLAVGVDGQVDTSAQVVAPGSPDKVETGSTTNADVGLLVTALSADGTTAATLKEVNNTSSVTVIKVADVATGNDKQTVDDALIKNKANIASLRAAIAANSQLKAKLDEKSVKASNVVALNVAASGAVTVFVE